MSGFDQQALMDRFKEIEQVEEDGGWDSLPSAFLLSVKDDKIGVEVVAVIDSSWPRPSMALEALADQLPKPQGTPIAVAFVSEGWAPPIPKGLSKADTKAWMATYPYKKFSDDPDRKEMRMLSGFAVDGNRYEVARERGMEPESAIISHANAEREARILGVKESTANPLKSLLDAWVNA